MKCIVARKGQVTSVEVTADCDSLTSPLNITGQGQATCRLDDVFNQNTGFEIALGRAIQDFGKQVEQVGHDRVTSIDELNKVLKALFG